MTNLELQTAKENIKIVQDSLNRLFVASKELGYEDFQKFLLEASEGFLRDKK